MAKLKTLKDIKIIDTSGPYGQSRMADCVGYAELKQEQIKWIKDAQKSWVTGSHTDNSHFVLDMWMKSLNITEEDLE